MKKLLSLLTVSVLSASSIAPITAMTEYKITNKIEKNTDEKSDRFVKTFKNIFGQVRGITINKNNTVYFGTIINNGLYVLSAEADTPTQIDGINLFILALAIDSDNNLYIGTDNGAYVLKSGETTPTQIDGINYRIYDVKIDSDNNIFFGTTNGAYVLKSGETTPTQIDGIDFVYSIFINNNIFFGTTNGAYVLKSGETTAKKIKGITGDVYSLVVDKNNTLYIEKGDGLYVLKSGATSATKINAISSRVYSLTIDKNNNLYIGTGDGLYVLKDGETTTSKITDISSTVYSLAVDKNNDVYLGGDKCAYIIQSKITWIKQQTKFTMVDSTKTQTWTRPDQISVDGEVDIDIANNNINTVYFDNVIQTQTAKKWHINVKPETSAKDHTLKVDFTIDGNKYTSEITVSMLAHIDPTPTPSQQNLSDLIKNTNIGNIIDNKDKTIFTAVNQANANVIDDISQLEITNKDNHKATISAKKDSKSYKGSVDVTYNVVPDTVVDLKVKLTPTSSQTITTSDYVGQIDPSNLTNNVNTFYYASGEVNIEMIKPTDKTSISGVVYGCDDKWNKTSQSSTIDPTSGIKLDGSQLKTVDGKYVVELTDNLGHTNNVYLQISKTKTVPEYWNTDNGKKFELWANANGYKNIRGYSAIQLNKLFETSKSWKQLASNQQIANTLAEWYKNNAKLVKNNIDFNSQLKSIVPKKITIDNFDTTLYNPDNVSFSITEKEKTAEISIKYMDTFSSSFELKIDGSSSQQDSNNKKLSGWVIFGIVIGSVVGVAIIGFLLKRFVISPYILEPRKEKRNQAILEKSRKEIAEFEEKEKREKGE